jgi:hypothetical protein
VRPTPAPVFLAPGFCDLHLSLNALFAFSALSVIRPDFFNVFLTVFSNVFFSASFALVEMTVSHSLVFVKLS